MHPAARCPCCGLLYQFGTPFQEMDAMTGRQQTTKGVWLAKAPKVDEVCTLILDLEGSDGRERGEDDTNFERQSALFALAVADVLLINVWCHDIGREQGSGKPLMKTIFQVWGELWPPSSPGDNSWRHVQPEMCGHVRRSGALHGCSVALHTCLRRQRPPAFRYACLPSLQVNLKLFAPEPNRRRTVLLFVIRDKSKTPLSKLVEVLSEDVHKMWDTISKPPQYTDSKIDDFFEVGLPWAAVVCSSSDDGGVGCGGDAQHQL